jgi:endonuclease YncB( thermonuclease family)
MRSLFVAVFFMLTGHLSGASPITAEDLNVIDGDTIQVDRKKPNVRLIGFNAPETRSALCNDERTLGLAAKARLDQLIASKTLDLEFVACSCAPGTEGTKVCNYGRKCAILKVDGRDVAEILVQEKLAVPFICGLTRCPRTPRPWSRID